MKNFLKLQLFALIILTFFLVLAIVRMPSSHPKLVEFYQPINNYILKDIKSDKSFWVSTSNDPYIILPKIKILNSPESFFYIDINYTSKSCRASLGESASFIQIFWRTSDEGFSENKSDTTPISMGGSSYLIPLRSLSLLSNIPDKTVEVNFRLDIVNKIRCKFQINKIMLGTFE